MPLVHFPKHLTNQFPVPAECRAEGNSVRAAIDDLERQYPGLAAYLIDERGALRKHVNVFLGTQLIRDREQLSDAIAQGDEVFVMQALSGG